MSFGQFHLAVDGLDVACLGSDEANIPAAWTFRRGPCFGGDQGGMLSLYEATELDAGFVSEIFDQRIMGRAAKVLFGSL